MKTRTGLTLAVLLLVAHIGSPQEAAQSEFFPIEIGNEWHYRVGDEKVVIRVARHDVVETTDDKEKLTKTTAAVLELKSGMRVVLEKVTVLADGVYRMSTAGHQINPPLRFLKLPVKEGDKWLVQSESEAVPLKGTFTLSRETIVVPAGKFEAYKAVTRDFQIGDNTTSITYWFAENVGMVKQQVDVGKFDSRILELEKFVRKKAE